MTRTLLGTRLWTLMLFAAIAAVPAPAPAQHGAVPVEVPLRIEGGRLTVAVKAADGTEFDFILATGTPPTILSASTAAKLGDTPALTLGGLAVDFTGSQTLSDASLEMDGFAFDGMVGPETLNDYDVLIDVPGGRLVLRPIGRPAPWAGTSLGDAVPIRVFHGQMLAMNVELNGQTFFASLDTGRNVLVVNEPVTAHLHAEPTFAGTIEFGGARITDLPVETINVDVMARWDPDNKGFVLVGAPIAYDCAIAISWVRSEIQMCAR